MQLTLLLSELPGVLAVLSAIGLYKIIKLYYISVIIIMLVRSGVE